MSEIIVLGCSLSAQLGYANYIAEKYQRPVHNLSVSAGSNELQQFRLSNLYLDNKVNQESIILWQVTAPTRKFMFSPYGDDTRSCNGTPFWGKYDWIPQDVALVREKSVVWINHHERVMDLPNHLTPAAALQMLAVDIFQWSLLVKKVFVTMGWKDLADPDTLDRFIGFLTSKNIEVLPLDQCIVDWCRDKRQRFSDESHPDEKGYINWFRHNLEPRLRPLLEEKEQTHA